MRSYTDQNKNRLQIKTSKNNIDMKKKKNPQRATWHANLAYLYLKSFNLLILWRKERFCTCFSTSPPSWRSTRWYYSEHHNAKTNTVLKAMLTNANALSRETDVMAFENVFFFKKLKHTKQSIHLIQIIKMKWLSWLPAISSISAVCQIPAHL